MHGMYMPSNFFPANFFERQDVAFKPGENMSIRSYLLSALDLCVEKPLLQGEHTF